MKTTKHVVLRVQDRPIFRNIDAICEATGVDPKSVRRGYMRASGATLPSDSGVALWWPSETSDKYENRLSSDGRTFTSRPKKCSYSHDYAVADAESGRRTAVFFREAGKPCGYRFVGVFKTNLEKTREQHRHVYDFVSDELEV